jgi:hypothetical protein
MGAIGAVVSQRRLARSRGLRKEADQRSGPVRVTPATGKGTRIQPTQPRHPDVPAIPVAAYVVNREGTVTPITTDTNTAGTPITVGSGPDTITPDGITAYVANFDSGTVTPITIATNTAGTPITAGSTPDAIAITQFPPLAAPSDLAAAVAGPVSGAAVWRGAHLDGQRDRPASDAGAGRARVRPRVQHRRPIISDSAGGPRWCPCPAGPRRGWPPTPTADRRRCGPRR